jgi:hypothetical protein
MGEGEDLTRIRDAVVRYLDALRSDSNVDEARDRYHQALKDAGWYSPFRGREDRPPPAPIVVAKPDRQSPG